MGRIGTVRHENYDADKLERIYKVIDIASKTESKKDYEILLDDLQIVPRTSDPEKFDSFNEHITQKSECLTLYLYFGASQHADTYFFYFKGVPASKLKSHGLSGLGLEELEKQQKEK